MEREDRETETETTTTWDSDKKWEKRLRVLSHVITSPTTSPPISSQLLVSSQSLDYNNWAHHPPSTRPAPDQWAWAAGLFLRRAFGPGATWRARSPYTHPPPLVLADGLGPAQWAGEERRAYAKRRLRMRRRLPPIPAFATLCGSTLVVLYIIFWDPFGEGPTWGR